MDDPLSRRLFAAYSLKIKLSDDNTSIDYDGKWENLTPREQGLWHTLVRLARTLIAEEADGQT